MDGEHASAFADAAHAHASDYATITHDHDLTYATAAHDHDLDYADAAHAHALDDLTDVTLGTPATGHVLTYDTDHWESAALVRARQAGEQLAVDNLHPHLLRTLELAQQLGYL